METPYLNRFLQFPSHNQLNEILPEIEKLENSIDKSKELLKVDAFEKHLINLLKTNKYSGYDRETLIEAFRIMDIGKYRYLYLYTFYTFVTRYNNIYKK